MMANSEDATRSAAITGAGSGLGRDIALGLWEKGYRVFGTTLSEDEIRDLKAASDGQIELSVCDITDFGSVKAWAGSVSNALGPSGLDLLVSNAGILTPGPVETLPLDAIRREFEVNLFGALAVVNAFLPALRKARGRVLQISTWTARVPLPFNGPSGASKAAMEVFAQVLRAEQAPFGVDFTIVSAGNMNTGGPRKTAEALQQVMDGMTEEHRKLFGETFGTFAQKLNAMQSAGMESAAAAARVIEIAELTPAPSLATVGEDAKEMLHAASVKSDKELDELRLEIIGLSRQP